MLTRKEIDESLRIIGLVGAGPPKNGVYPLEHYDHDGNPIIEEGAYSEEEHELASVDEQDPCALAKARAFRKLIQARVSREKS